MAYQIVWTAKAKLTYLSILDYLIEEWTEREVRSFVVRVNSKLNLLSEQPAIGKVHNKRYRIHKTLVHKYVSLVYHVKPIKREIVLLTFWDDRRNPSKLKF